MSVQFRRPDGSFVMLVNGLPFHVTSDHPLFAANVGAAQSAPLEPGAVAPSIEAQRAAMILTDIQFAIACVGAGLMTAQEAEDWVGAGVLPAAAETAIAALPEAQRAAARIRFRGARTIARLDPFISVVQAVLSLTPEQIDNIFEAGAAL